mmetsp:Transcript_26654/g.63324  ORF Transcript_26654/g.63324 Transcript_26654/m.63324 type:complete len:372 (-) Transcript_26654:367-1482(-)
MQYRREGQEATPFLGILEAVSLRHVAILPVQLLALHVFGERLLQVLAPLHVERKVVKLLCANRREVHVHTLDKVLELPAEQARDLSVHRCALHLLLEVIAQHAIELLHVVLRERVERIPSEAFGQSLGPYARPRVLQLVKHPLERQRHGVHGVRPWLRPVDHRWVVAFSTLPLPRLLLGRHLVHRSPERWYVVQRLEEGVHVAGRALVLETDKACLRLGVAQPQVQLREPVLAVLALLEQTHRDLDGDGVVGQQDGGLLAQHAVPQEVLEAPVRIVRREQMLRLLALKHPVLRTEHCELEDGIERVVAVDLLHVLRVQERRHVLRLRVSLGEEEDTPPHACHDELGTVELVWQLRELPNPPFDTEDVRMSG